MAAGDDTALVTSVIGYQAEATGLSALVTSVVGYQAEATGLSSLVVSVVGYVPPDPPVAVVPDITGTVGTPATFDGSATTGPADTILAWAWTSIPAGSTVAPATTLPFPFPDNGAATPIDMTDNVGLYHFEGDATDSSGQGNDGTITGAALTTGKVGSSAYSFSGSANIQVGTGTTFNFTSADAFSFSLWVKPGASQTPYTKVLGKLFYPTGYALEQAGFSTNQFWFVSGTGSGWMYSPATPVLSAGVWHHIAITRSSAGAVTIYVNGISVVTSTHASIASAPSVPFQIGSSSAYGGTFTGDIDEVAVWERELSSTEIENIYTLQAPLFPPTPLPDNAVSNTLDLSMASNEGLYHFEGGANDSSGNGRNGTVSGATLTTGKVGSNAYAFAHADSTDIITFGSAGFDFVSADAFSFSMWVKPNASQPGVNAVLFSKTNFGTAGYALVQNGGANSNLYTLIVGTGSGLTGTGVNFALTAGAWSHVCVTRSANGAQTRIYVNNVLVTDVSTLTTIASSGGITLGIGNFSAVPQAALAFNGDIDEFCVWSRELTPLEVETVYDYGNGTYAGWGETFTFTPDVAGTYTVEAEATSAWGSDSTTADAVISAVVPPGGGPPLGGLSIGGMRIHGMRIRGMPL